jgi:hypothetical protein
VKQKITHQSRGFTEKLRRQPGHLEHFEPDAHAGAANGPRVKTGTCPTCRAVPVNRLNMRRG